MTLKEGLIAARSHIVFVLGLITAFSIVIWLERWNMHAADQPSGADSMITPSSDIPRPTTAPLDEAGLAAARTAWAYFAANTRPETGLVDTVAGFPATTLWDTGSYLLALVAAERLGIVTTAELDRRADQALGSLKALPLVDGRLPNKSIDTRNLAMTTYDGKPAPDGIGWSALDLGRSLVPLAALARFHPEQAGNVAAVLDAWDVSAAVADGELIGAVREGSGPLERVQEGRVGYEQYGARAMLLTGRDAITALRVENHLRWVEVDGIQVPSDDRTAERSGAHTYVLSEPYLLTALELGWDVQSRELGWRVYEAQAQRFETTGHLTAVSEDHLDRDPRFIYSTVWANDEPWAVLGPDGKAAPGDRILSTKAAFAWDALYATDYTRRLVLALADARDPAKGWYGGIYEADGSLNRVLSVNTNAVILESLHYRAFGPLLHPTAGPRHNAEASR